MSSEHPDEGTIHAWLDGALSDADSARIAEHVARCASCATAAAEARGLIAGASRVVRALDPAGAPAEGVAAWGTPAAAPRTADSSVWRMLRVTPARAAIAATVLVVAGIALTRDWMAQESTIAPRAGAVAMAPRPAPEPSLAAPVRDPLLDSAIKRRVAQAAPLRAVEAAPGPAIPRAPVPSSATAVDAAAPRRVAAGRSEEQVRRETTEVVADASASSFSAKSAPVAAPAIAPMAPLAGSSPSQAPASGARMCLRVESPTPGATWGGVALPLVLALNDGAAERGSARIIGQGADQGASASWRREGADTLHVALRRIGYMGSMELALAPDAGGGTMRSAQTTSQLSEVVVTGVGAPDSETTQTKSRVTADRRMKMRAKSSAAPAAPASVAPAPAGAAIGVVARRVTCP